MELTGKRFRISQGYTDRFCHDWQNNQLLNFRETVELLNELHEENQERKRAMRIAEQYNEQLLNENKKLKKYLDSISKGGLE